MNIVQSLINFLKNRDSSNQSEVPEGLFPNCWGREEYGGHFYDRVRQENLNIHSTVSNVGWIQAYANKHLSGIALQRSGDGHELICQKCKVSYQQSDDDSNT